MKRKKRLQDKVENVASSLISALLWVTGFLGGVIWTDMVSQAVELSNQPHVVVATPGRLADHIRSSDTFNMRKIKFLVRKKININILSLMEPRFKSVAINEPIN